MTTQKRLGIFACVFCLCAVVVGTGFLVYDNNRHFLNFEMQDNLEMSNGEKAKVILLAGQSNASGCSIVSCLQKNVSAQKFAEYENGFDNVFINFYSSGANMSNGFVKTATGQGDSEDHFGPELGIAEKLHQQNPDDLFFIIKFAWSGTDLFEHWLSPSSNGKTGFLYSNFVRYINQNLKYLKQKGYVPEVVGLCWMQGESDSFFVKTATDYEIHLKNFVADLRKELSAWSQEEFAFVDATIADNPVFWVYCDLVNESKLKVSKLSNKNVLIDTNAKGLECDKEPESAPDIPHYDSLSEIKLGNLFAEKLLLFLK